MEAQKTNRRDFLKVAAGTVGAGVAVASGLGAGVKASAATTAAVRTPSIEPQGTFWGLNYQPHVQAYHRMADLFKKQTGSTVKVQPQPGAPYTQLIASIAAGTQPDLCFTLASVITPLAVQGALNPLNDSVYKAQNVNIARDFVGDCVEAFSFNNKIYGVPSETDGGLGLVVNVPVDDVKRLGLASKYPPTNGQTYFKSYDDLFALAKALQVTKNGRVVRYGLSGEGWDDAALGSIMLTLGTPPFDSKTETFTFTSPAGIQAMRYHVEIPVKMGIEREWNDPNAVVDVPLQGKVAMSIGNGAPAQEGPAYGYHFQTAVVPKLNGKTPISLGTGSIWGTVGPARAPHPKLQAAFLRMMCTSEGQYQYLLTYGGVNVVAWKPLLMDTSRYQPKNETNGEWAAWKEGWIPAALENCQYIGQAGYWNKVQLAIAAGCQAVREGKLNSAQGMAQIQAAAEAQYRQYKIDLSNLQ